MTRRLVDLRIGPAETDGSRRGLSVRVPAEIFGDWCVHEACLGDPKHGYRVSHVPTGMRPSAVDFATMESAQWAARLLRERMRGFAPHQKTGKVDDGDAWRGIIEAAFAEVLAS